MYYYAVQWTSINQYIYSARHTLQIDHLQTRLGGSSRGPGYVCVGGSAGAVVLEVEVEVWS